MAKLGYTWYPKDWGNSEAVFELTLEQRGFYRELIDMAMLNDNKTIINEKTWCRKFNVNDEKLEEILNILLSLGLIQVDFDGSNELFIPSCEPRLKLSRGGKNGGKKSRRSKPTVKPFVSLEEKNDKPTLNQIESKLKEKESKVNIYHTHETFIEWFNECRKFIKLQSNIKKLSTIEKQQFKELENTYTKEDFKKAFKNFSSDKYYKDNNLLFPIHFLKLENFTKYLNAEVKQELTLGQKLNGRM